MIQTNNNQDSDQQEPKQTSMIQTNKNQKNKHDSD